MIWYVTYITKTSKLLCLKIPDCWLLTAPSLEVIVRDCHRWGASRKMPLQPWEPLRSFKQGCVFDQFQESLSRCRLEKGSQKESWTIEDFHIFRSWVMKATGFVPISAAPSPPIACSGVWSPWTWEGCHACKDGAPKQRVLDSLS